MSPFQCAVAARGRDDQLLATAAPVRRWLLVEVRGAWGRDAIAESALGAVLPTGWRDRRRVDGIRVVAIRRDLARDEDADVHLFYADSGNRATAGSLWSLVVPSLSAAMDATESLPAPAAHEAWRLEDEPLVLVCTNGRHDSCCATFGRPLVRSLRTSARRDRVWECSHIGGDRFAANLVVLPDGLYFGRCNVSGAARILDAHERGELVLEHYRGRSVYAFAEQAAEHLVRRRLGITAIEGVVDVRPGGEDPDAYEVVVDDGGARHVLAVTVRRTMHPVSAPLTCAGRPGSSAPVWELVRVTVRS